MNNKENTQNLVMLDDSELRDISGGAVECTPMQTLNISLPLCTLGPNSSIETLSTDKPNSKLQTLELTDDDFAVLLKRP